MRSLYGLDKYRALEWELRFAGQPGDNLNGCFFVPSPIDRQALRIIASVGAEWDHVSVSRASRCPNWPEMDFVKRLFFHPHEVAMQLHVAEQDHISYNDFTLHLWRPHFAKIPLPPSEMVGPQTPREAVG